MLVDGGQYRVNVLILCMEDEVDVTLFSVQCLLRNLEEGVIISLLLNGGHSEALQRLSQEDGRLRYYRVERNLGVAGGRNYLLRTEECRESDVVLILDNDVIPPVDFVRNLVTFLLRQEDAGVVGAVVANVKPFAGSRRLEDVGHELANLRSADMKKRVLDDLTRDKIYHMGVCKDYHYAYFSGVPKCLQVLGYLKVFAALRCLFGIYVNVYPHLKNNSKYLKMIVDGVDKYEVSNVAGCGQAFRRGLVTHIGCLDDRFSPYGFEDVEFCIRAMQSGYRNYIDTNTWLLHGTDERHASRTPSESLVSHYRGRTILGSILYRSAGKLRKVMVRLIVILFVVDFLHSPLTAITELRYRLAGYRKGLQAVA